MASGCQEGWSRMSRSQDDEAVKAVESDEAERRTAEQNEALQRYADSLSGVILRGGMCHGVTVALSVDDPVTGPRLVSNHSFQPGTPDRLKQAEYGVAHMAALEAGARQAKEEIKAAREKAIAEKEPGGPVQ